MGRVGSTIEIGQISQPRVEVQKAGLLYTFARDVVPTRRPPQLYFDVETSELGSLESVNARLDVLGDLDDGYEMQISASLPAHQSYWSSEEIGQVKTMLEGFYKPETMTVDRMDYGMGTGINQLTIRDSQGPILRIQFGEESEFGQWLEHTWRNKQKEDYTRGQDEEGKKYYEEVLKPDSQSSVIPNDDLRIYQALLGSPVSGDPISQKELTAEMRSFARFAERALSAVCKVKGLQPPGRITLIPSKRIHP